MVKGDSSGALEPEFEELGVGLNSTRPGLHIARLAAMLIESNARTAVTIDRLAHSLEVSSRRAERLSGALVLCTLLLALSTTACAIIPFFRHQPAATTAIETPSQSGTSSFEDSATGQILGPRR
jgi:hypothetical protein